MPLPNVDDVKQGIMASKIAAHAADIAKHIPHARDMDDKMADARRNLDWEGQWACATGSGGRQRLSVMTGVRSMRIPVPCAENSVRCAA